MPVTIDDITPAVVGMLDWCPQLPTERQTAFLELPHLEAMYGGAAGGGKSSALLMGALMYAHVPGYAALILRRTYQDLALPGAIMDRAEEWLRGSGATWTQDTKTWHFPSGATLTFGYLQYEKDKYRYQGAEFQYVAFDELTQFTETQYRYLLSRLRRLTGSQVPIRARSATNPGGIGHYWVKERFIDPETSEGRRFVPALLEDNPHLDADEYDLALAELDAVTRQQLRRGDWDVQPSGGYFDRAWFLVVDQAPADLERIGRSWDEGGTEGGGDPTAGALVGLKDGVWYLMDMQHGQWSAANVDSMMDQTAAVDGREVPILLQQDPGSAGKARIAAHRQRLVGHDVRSLPPTGAKAVRARPMASAAEAGNFRLVRGSWNRSFLDEAALFTGEEGGVDDQIDAASWGILMLSAKSGKAADGPVQVGPAAVGGSRRAGVSKNIRPNRSGSIRPGRR